MTNGTYALNPQETFPRPSGHNQEKQLTFDQLQEAPGSVLSLHVPAAARSVACIESTSSGALQKSQTVATSRSRRFPKTSTPSLLLVSYVMLPRPTSHSPALGPGCTGPSLAQYVPESADTRIKPTVQQPLSGAAGFMIDPQAATTFRTGQEPWKHTTTPYVTGTSVLGVTYKDGVLIAADTLGSYGSTKRYKSFERLRKVNDQTIIGAGGELSDFQYILNLLDELSNEDFCADDGAKLSPKEIHAYLTRVLYNRRSKFDPLWNSLVIGGIQEGKPFLSTVTMLGVHFSDDHIATVVVASPPPFLVRFTGFGQMLARPLFRERWRPDLSEEEAIALLHDGLRVCYYRDKQTTNKFQIAKVTAEGTTISEPFALDTKWDYKAFVNPGALAVGTW